MVHNGGAAEERKWQVLFYTLYPFLPLIRVLLGVNAGETWNDARVVVGTAGYGPYLLSMVPIIHPWIGFWTKSEQTVRGVTFFWTELNRIFMVLSRIAMRLRCLMDELIAAYTTKTMSDPASDIKMIHVTTLLTLHSPPQKVLRNSLSCHRYVASRWCMWLAWTHIF